MVCQTEPMEPMCLCQLDRVYIKFMFVSFFVLLEKRKNNNIYIFYEFIAILYLTLSNLHATNPVNGISWCLI